MHLPFDPMRRVSHRILNRRAFLGGVASVCASLRSVTGSRAQPIRKTAMPRSARDRLEEALSRIADTGGEGARACLTVYTDTARAAADAADARSRAGISLGPLDGAIVSIKDLFDVAGEPTRAGSKIL